MAAAAQAQDFAPGQVWTFKDAAPPASRVIVGRVDQLPDGSAIVSICVTDAPIPTKTEPLQTIGHLPFDAEALRQSVIEQVGDVPVPPEFAEGYRTWRDSYDKDDAGAFAIPVADAVRYVKDIVEAK